MYTEKNQSKKIQKACSNISNTINRAFAVRELTWLLRDIRVYNKIFPCLFYLTEKDPQGIPNRKIIKICKRISQEKISPCRTPYINTKKSPCYLTVILRENQADSMESQFLGYLEISQSIRKSKVLMSKTRKTTFEEFCHFLFFRERGI